eukprot:5559941-Prymnesium_polylepis.1
MVSRNCMNDSTEWPRIAVQPPWTKPWLATVSRSSSESARLPSVWRWVRARLGIGRLSWHVARSEYDEHAGPTWSRCPDTMDKAVACNGIAFKF